MIDDRGSPVWDDLAGLAGQSIGTERNRDDPTERSFRVRGRASLRILTTQKKTLLISVEVDKPPIE